MPVITRLVESPVSLMASSGALAAVAVMVIYLHRGNIQRLIHGTERKTYLHKPAN